MKRAGLEAQRVLDLHKAWRRLFLRDDGTLKEDALVVLADLEAECYQTRSTVDGTPIDPLRMAMNEGKRTLYHIVKRRLYQPLDALVRKTEDGQ